jgi:hypothetical protein
MTIGLRLQSLSFSGDEEHPVEVGSSDVVVLIGPNNAGKSRALRDAEVLLETGLAGEVVRTLSAKRSGDGDAMRDWIVERAPLSPNAPPAQTIRTLPDGRVFNENAAVEAWASDATLEQFARLLVFRADAETRLHLANSVDSIDPLKGQAIKPLQRLLTDRTAERRLSQSTQRAFGSPVHVYRGGGNTIHLHLGDTEAKPVMGDPEYMSELANLPLVAEQGDGMRSFIGLMLALTALPYPLVLIDEPEAFLHPPQAREIGRQLAVSDGRQRVVATHSPDVLLGLVEAADSLTVVRLRRDGDRNVPAVLTAQQIREVWDDPSLRYSNLLSGLFHSGAVITEADGDARLYAAALDEDLTERERPASNLLFTHCGGKYKLPAAVGALRPMGVPVAAIADLDILRGEDLLRRTVEAFSADWSLFRADWRIVNNAVANQPAPAPPVCEVKKQVDDALGSDETARLSEKQVRRIREITTTPDGWKRARESGGLSALPRGDATAAAKRLVAGLREIGLFVVPVGALEGWAPQIGDRGPKFVASALSGNVHRENVDLRRFVANAADYLATSGTS